MTQRVVPGAGKSAIVRGLPSGPITQFGFTRMDIFIEALTLTTELLFECSTASNGANLQKVIEIVNDGDPQIIWLNIVRHCECGLLADCVAKVPYRGATIFSPGDETSRDRRLIWPRLVTEAAGEFITMRRGPPYIYSKNASTAQRIIDQ